MSEREAIEKLIIPVIEQCGAEFDDLAIQKNGKYRVLAIELDREGGIDLDLVAEVSRGISDVLDASDAMGNAPYTLEVSSRGVDKPLVLPRHWTRNIGRLVKISGSGEAITGRISEVTDSHVVLDVKGTATVLDFPIDGRSVIQVEFNKG